MTTNCWHHFSLQACPVQYLITGCHSYSSSTSSLSTSQARRMWWLMQWSRLRTLGLYQDNGNTDLAKTDSDIVDNVVEEVHAIEWIPNSATYKMEKLNLDILREAQQQDTFCMKKAKSVRSKEVDGFVLDENGILHKFVMLKYTLEPTIVVPRKLTSLII